MTFRPTLAGAACLLTIWSAAAPRTDLDPTASAAARVQDPAPAPARQDPELTAHLDAASRAFAAGDYLTAGDRLREADTLVRSRFEKAIRETLPRVTDDYTAVEPPPPAAPGRAGGNGPMPVTPRIAAAGGSIDRPVELRYRARDGRGVLRVLVAPRTPGVRAALTLLSQVDEREEVELLEVGSHLGTLESGRTMVRSRFVLGREHLIEVQGLGAEPEHVAGLLTRRTLDKLTELLTAGR